MLPALILVFLLAGLLALVPVWRLRGADWPPAWLFAAWATYGVLILLVMRFAGVTRFLLPILVVAYIAPFVVGPERLSRLVPRRQTPERTVIDVTPSPPDGLPDPGAAADAPPVKPSGATAPAHRSRAAGRPAGRRRGRVLTAESGLLALHGGGEYVTGDEPAMDALIGAVPEADDGRPTRVVLLPTAVARHRPELAAAHGTRAFEAAAARAGRVVEVRVAMVVDARSAMDPSLAAVLEDADLIHLPGGDPDVIPSVLPGTATWAAALRAHARGACLAGASAGAMALAARLWTPRGPAAGLGLVPGLAVLPHFQRDRLRAWRTIVDPEGTLAWLGLAEQTLVVGSATSGWRVAGAGRARVFAPGSDREAAGAGPGERIDLRVG